MAVARADVAASLQFVEQLREKELVGACYAELLPEWRVRLAGAELSLRSHCWSMIVAQAVQMP